MEARTSTHNPLKMANQTFEMCKVCFNNFDISVHRPRVLPCGHTFCSPCLGDILKSPLLTCPNCRINHTTRHITQFPINYDMESLIEILHSDQPMPGTARVPPAQAEGAIDRQEPSPRGISEKIKLLVEEQKCSVRGIIAGYEEAQSQLDEYQGQLGFWKTQHQQLLDELYGLVRRSKAALALVEQEKASVKDIQIEGKEEKQQLEAKLVSLDTVNSVQEAVTAMEDADRCILKSGDWIQKCHEFFPNVGTVHTSLKLQEAIRSILWRATELDSEAAPVRLEDSASTIMQRVQAVLTKISLFEKNMTVTTLTDMSKETEGMVQANLVWAVQNERCSRITVQDRELCLHPLLHQPMPINARIVKHSDLVASMNLCWPLDFRPNSRRASLFLDLGWAGSTQGRVYIRLRPVVHQKIKPFVRFWTGELGGSFMKSHFEDVVNKNAPGEYVDIDLPLVLSGSGIPSSNAFPSSFRAGCMWIYIKKRFNVYKLAITTRDAKSNSFAKEDLFLVGEVERGLEVVRAAASHSNIQEVTVVDCGLVSEL